MKAWGLTSGMPGCTPNFAESYYERTDCLQVALEVFPEMTPKEYKALCEENFVTFKGKRFEEMAMAYIEIAQFEREEEEAEE